MPESDEKLYRRFRAEGNSDDLAILLRRHGEALTLFIFGYVHNSEDAEELMMDAFAVVAGGAHPFAGRSSFRTWLFSVGKRLALEHLRKHHVTTEIIDAATAGGLAPELVLLKEERNRQLYQGLTQIKTEYRQALCLYYFEGMTYEQAGRVMGKSRRQMYNLMERGRKALKEALEGMGYDHADY